MLLRVTPIAVAFVIAVLFAMWLARFIDVDSCLDAGGAFRDSGFCDVPNGPYVPVFARRGLHALWATFLAVTFTVGWVVKRGMDSLFRRAFTNRPV